MPAGFVAIALLAGCALTPTQKRVATTVGAALVVGAVIAHKSDGDPPPTFNKRCNAPSGKIGASEHRLPVIC